MRAIVDILKSTGTYTFMAVKERLLQTIDAALQGTEYEGKYGLSGSFTNTDQTISIVVGVLAERQLNEFISLGTGSYTGQGTPGFREYTYGINVTGINDEEVKSLARYIFYKIIDHIPTINREERARIHPDLYMQPVASQSVGDKRMWYINIYATAAVNEYYPYKPDPNLIQIEPGATGLDADGYVPPGYSSCVIIRETPWYPKDNDVFEGSTTAEPTTTPESTTTEMP